MNISFTTLISRFAAPHILRTAARINSDNCKPFADVIPEASWNSSEKDIQEAVHFQSILRSSLGKVDNDSDFAVGEIVTGEIYRLHLNRKTRQVLFVSARIKDGRTIRLWKDAFYVSDHLLNHCDIGDKVVVQKIGWKNGYSETKWQLLQLEKTAR